jgi:RimJ/RimL family protein N-acetyltransferase
MASTSRIHSVTLRPSLVSDLPFVIAAERHTNNLTYVGQWNYDQHQAAINSADKVHLILERLDDQEPVGYAILEGLTDMNHSILLRRIVVTEKGKGYGRAALQKLKQLVFETYSAHRFWLDVKSFNPRARHLYESEGFVLEGCLRDALKTEDGYHSMYIMSLLRPEYQSAKTSAAPEKRN